MLPLDTELFEYCLNAYIPNRTVNVLLTSKTNVELPLYDSMITTTPSNKCIAVAGMSYKSKTGLTYLWFIFMSSD